MRKKLQKKKMIKDAFLFLLKLNLLLIPFYLIIHFDVNFYPVQIFFAKSIVFVLNVFGVESFNVDFFVYLGKQRFPVDISRDCVGWKSLYSLFAMVLASPGKFKDKKNFLVIWLPVMFLINIFRIFSTITVGFLFSFRVMDVVHNFVWQNLTVVLILLVWFFYIRKNYLSTKKSEL